MSDLENDKDLAIFGEEDNIKPIDLGGPAAGKAPARADVLPPIIDPDSRKPGAIPIKSDKPREPNAILKGDYLDLLDKNPTMRQICIAAGWEQRTIDEVKIDVDLSCFLLDKTGQTRNDEDFVFYNNEKAIEGAVKHMGDSRTGAGDGDDEVVFIDLQGIPFDVIKVMIVLSIYDDEHTKKNFGMLRDMYVRIVNNENDDEIMRFTIEDDLVRGFNGFLSLCLVREGPKWFVECVGNASRDGLAAIAKGYGIIVKEQTG